MPEELLKVQDLRMHYKTREGMVQAVDGISFSVTKGQAVALVGESGSGKTATALTTIRLLPKNARILGGSVNFSGRDLLELDDVQIRELRGKVISMVFQDPLSFLNPVLRVGDQVAEVLRLHMGMDKEEGRKHVIELLKMVQIPAAKEVYTYYPHQMSGGMRQRILIATALACNPSLVILDEPTTALDATVQAQIINLIRTLRKELELSLILITHDLGVVAEICDQVYVMYAGKIVEHASVYTLYKDPKHPYTQGLLRSNISVLESSRFLETMKGMPPNLLDPPPGCRFHPRCPHVMNICSNEEPPVFCVNTHQCAKCWLYEPMIKYEARP